MRGLFLAMIALLGASAARAEVTDRSAQGFEVVQAFETKAAPETAWAAVLKPAAWWSGAHSWSGSAANLAMDLERECFCEALPNAGSVRHMAIVYNDNKSTLRLEGALGPLVFTGASGHLSFVVAPAGTGSKVTLTYAVGGYAKGGLAEAWAAPVDAVLGEQMGRLKAYLDK